MNNRFYAIRTTIPVLDKSVGSYKIHIMESKPIKDQLAFVVYGKTPEKATKRANDLLDVINSDGSLG